MDDLSRHQAPRTPFRRTLHRCGLAAGAVGTLVMLGSLAALAAAPEPAPHSVIFFTGSVDGFLSECGCARFPLGGLDRRAGYIAQVRKRWPRTNTVLLDTGNFTDAGGAGAEFRTRSLVRAMSRMGYLASGVGEREILGGHDFFQQLVAEAQFPFVSTNLVHARDGSPWLSPNTIVMLGSLRIGVLAVTRHNPALRLGLPDGDAIVTVDPITALQGQLPRFRAGRDIVVVLASMPIEDARLLARRVAGIDLILGAHGGRVTTEPIVEGQTRIVYAGDEGKYLGEIDVYKRHDGLGFHATVAILGDGVPPDPAVATFVADAVKSAQALDRQRRPEQAQDGSRSYVGSAICARCHAPIVADWAQSDHGRAFVNLQRRGPVQEGCLACHTTGYGQPGGFADPAATPYLLNVGCESCHGPAATHLEQPERPYGRIAVANCTSCHTPEMDPRFNFYEDRTLIRHGSAEK